MCVLKSETYKYLSCLSCFGYGIPKANDIELINLLLRALEVGNCKSRGQVHSRVFTQQKVEEETSKEMK